MADRPAKRRKKDLVLFMGNLPPDVVVSHILPHIVIGVDVYTSYQDQVGPDAETLSCFGYFTGDPLRYPWAIFRSISATLSLLYAARPQIAAVIDERHMIIPLRHIVHFTLSSSIDIPEESPEMHSFIDDLKWSHDRKPLPILERVSSVLLADPVDSNKLYPRAETIFVQAGMKKIPNWCETLILRDDEDSDSPWLSVDDPAFWLSNIGKHSCWNLTNVIVEIGTCLDRLEVVWDMQNVKYLEKFVIGRGYWIPLQPRYREIAVDTDYQEHDAPDYHDYDFLRPLQSLKQLSLRLFLPPTYNSSWYLPPVKHRIDVTGFRVPAGFLIPPNARFVSCQWDPTCVYTVRPGHRNVLEIGQNVKHDAPNSVYESTSRCGDVLEHLPGRTTIRGSLYKLKYSADSFDLLRPAATGDITESTTKNMRAVSDRLGLPFEFMFIGDIHKAVISSSPVLSAGMPDNRIILHGQVDKVELKDSKSLELKVNNVDNLHVDMCRNCYVTVGGSIDGVDLVNSGVELIASHIDILSVEYGDVGLSVISDVHLLIIDELKYDAEFVGNIDKVRIDECEKMVTITGDVTELASFKTRGTIAVTGSVGRAVINGPMISYVYTRVEFGRVSALHIGSGFVDIVVHDMNSIEMVIFGKVWAEQIEFHGKRIDNRKLIFRGTSDIEIRRIQKKISL